MKICLASMAPFVGGAEVAAERLGIGLLEAGHDVVVVLGERNEVFERMAAAGLRCIHAPMYFTDKWRFVRYFRARNQLRRILQTEAPDILHNNDLPTHQILSDAARPLGLPRVCHHRFPFEGSVIDWLNKYGAERHLFVSQALMDDMCACSTRLRGAPRSVVYDGLPLPPVPTAAARRDARDRLELPQDRVLVAFTGQIIERKGVAELVRAWAQLDPDVAVRAELVIVGDDLAGKGRYRSAMESLAGELRVEPRFVGFQQNVGDWLQAADLAVVPSHVEPLGNATLEAMAFGLPVIGSRVGGIPEMIVHESTGLLIPPKNPMDFAVALTRLIRDDRLRGELGANARCRCEERFSLRAHVEAVVHEYEIAMSQRISAQAS